MLVSYASRSFLGATLLGALFTLGTVAPAAAQDQAENVAAARTLGIQGVQLADAGNCKEAIEKLSRAESLYHAPTILGRLGECQVNVGQIVLGTENLNRVVREQLPANAPKAFKDAQLRARKALDAALPRIGHLTVSVQVEPPTTPVSVTVSGAAVPTALLGVERPTDPGTHEVVATADGYLPAKTSVALAEGGRQSITLTLSPDPNAVKAAAPAEPAPAPVVPVTPPPPAAARAGGSSKTLAFVLLGVGGAGIVTGSITGLFAIDKKNGLDCPRNRCSGSDADDLDSAKTLALVSTIGFGVGIASAAAGTVLLLTSSGSSETHASTLSEKKRVSFTPYLGVANAGVTGSFW
jgi:hypothetical protein